MNDVLRKFKFAVVAVDVVVLTVVDDKLKVLLLELQESPYEGKWALPGGMVGGEESLDEAAVRHLKEKAGVNNVFLEQLYTFGAPNRDRRGRVISVGYFALVPYKRLNLQTTSRYKSIELRVVNNLPEMAYDHKEIIKTAEERLKSKLEYTNIIYSLMPREFTLTELQNMYELILNKELDKRNFRRKIKDLGILKSFGKKRTGDNHRPAQMYTFKETSPKVVEII